jgi:hypothetical protein
VYDSSFLLPCLVLIAALNGQPPPLNNIGLLPLAYLDVGENDPRRVRLLVTNARQVLRQLARKHELKKEKIEAVVPWLFQPFPRNADGELARRLDEIEASLDRAVGRDDGGVRLGAAHLGELGAAHLGEYVQQVEEVFELGLEGLDYYHRWVERALSPAEKSPVSGRKEPCLRPKRALSPAEKSPVSGHEEPCHPQRAPR